MLNLGIETVCFIIARAREFQAKEQVVIPDSPSGSSDDWAMQILADHREDLTIQEVEAAAAHRDAKLQGDLPAPRATRRGQRGSRPRLAGGTHRPDVVGPR